MLPAELPSPRCQDVASIAQNQALQFRNDGVGAGFSYLPVQQYSRAARSGRRRGLGYGHFLGFAGTGSFGMGAGASEPAVDAEDVLSD